MGQGNLYLQHFFYLPVGVPLDAFCQPNIGDACSNLQDWLGKVLKKLPADKQDEFKEKSQPAIKYLMGKIKELQL